MDSKNRKEHWEYIYQTKGVDEVSWYQQVPSTSLKFVSDFKLPLNAKIIDIGGGDSLFVDHLIDAGYTDVTVLDISEISLERAKQRLGTRANNVKWINEDASLFKPCEKYDLWHDRAALHFLTQKHDIDNYMKALKQGLKHNGILVLATFSLAGPKKCSGIKIKQYSEASMQKLLNQFEKIKCITVDHKTPFDTAQNFLFCSFRNLMAA